MSETPPEDQCVRLHVQVSLAGQEVQSEETVVAPAFSNLEVGGELPDDVLGGVAGGLVDHLHAVLVPTPGRRHSLWFNPGRAAGWEVVVLIKNTLNHLTFN